MTDSTETLTAKPIARRTVIAGAAWAVPAIALSASTPAFAASGPVLSFNNSSYTGAACSVISGVRVTVTESGSPKAGVSTTALLAGGFTFSTGGTSYTGVTGAGGSMTLPDIAVPVGGGNSTVTGTASGAVSASASLVGTVQTSPFYATSDLTRRSASGVPDGSMPAVGGIFLSPDGRLIDGSSGYVWATNVNRYGNIYQSGSNGQWSMPLLKRDGSTTILRNDQSETQTTGIPADSQPIAGGMFLASDGRLIDGTNAYVWSTNVGACGLMYSSSNNSDWTMPIRKTSGSCVFLRNNASESAAAGVPSQSTPVQGAMFLASDGRLIDGSNGFVWSSNVDSCGRIFQSNSTGNWSMPLKKRDGSCAVLLNDASQKSATGVPSGSTPVQGGLFLSSDGRIIDGNGTGYVVARGVALVGVFYSASNDGGWSLALAVQKTTPTFLDNGTEKSAVGVTGGSMPAAASSFLTPDGRLLSGDAGVVQASNVQTVGDLYWDGSIWRWPIRKNDGSCTFLDAGTEKSAVGVPAGSRPIVASSFLTSDGRLISGDRGTLQASNIDTCGQLYWDGHIWRIPLRKRDGSFTFLDNGVEKNAVGIPANSVPAAGSSFLAPDGRLISGDQGIVQATDVSAFGRLFYNGTVWQWPLRKTSGSCSFLDSGIERTATGVPSGSEPVAAASFLTTDGHLISGDTGGVQAQDVIAFGQIYYDGAIWRQPLAKKKTSC
ncbi:hypothetical protein LPW41_10825 [Microbacterium sp. JC 701]|uniref:hypothetical protein n=1 Tax=Microbacterium sp. JC 701 TaxID=2897389 RepID=UPI001E5B1100|nr:hypothetical protein [Microbacterium sp. JC 701]MCD2170187.1 hypothetical protein [Microbacterium sp. JC 701]